MKYILVLLIPFVGVGLGMAYTWKEFDGIEEGFSDVKIPEMDRQAKGENPNEKPVDPATVPEDAPKVEVEGGLVHDFGTMLMFGTKSHTFTVKNVGKSALTLERLDSTCKCTVGLLKKSGLQPGESTTIKMEWSAKYPVEIFRQMARFRTNDPRKKILRLTIEGHVKRSMRYYPYELKFNGVSSSQSMTTEVRLFSVERGKQLEFTSHKFLEPETAEYFDVKFRKATQKEIDLNPGAHSGQIAYVTLKVGLPVGRIDQTLQLKTNLGDRVKIEIAIKGRVVSDVTFFGKGVDSTRNILKLGPVVRAQGLRTKLNVLVKGTKERRDKIKLKVVKVDPADILQVNLSKGKEKAKVRMHMLTLDIPPNSRPINRTLGKVSKPGLIVLETNDPETPQVRLRVDFAIQ